MCLILFAVEPASDLSLVVAYNRDEYHSRPTERAAIWAARPDLLSGRDQRSLGTWLGVTRDGRFAAITNYHRDRPAELRPHRRRSLPVAFLTSRLTPQRFVAALHETRHLFRDFSIVVSDGQEWVYYNSFCGEKRLLGPGYYGLSNRHLDCDWPKVTQGRQALQRSGASGFSNRQLFALLSEEGTTEPSTQRFVKSDVYGTKSSTAIKIWRDGTVEFEERSFGPLGANAGTQKFRLRPR